MNTAKYVRRPFEVDAVRVSATNMEEVAEWCGGEVRVSPETEHHAESNYVFVSVYRPLSERQTRAYPGDWVLSSPKGFRVFNSKAFNGAFIPA